MRETCGEIFVHVAHPNAKLANAELKLHVTFHAKRQMYAPEHEALQKKHAEAVETIQKMVLMGVEALGVSDQLKSMLKNEFCVPNEDATAAGQQFESTGILRDV